MRVQKHRHAVALAGCSAFALLGLAGCATETSHVLATPQVKASTVPYTGARRTLVVGKFDNRSSFGRGLFSDGVDRLGSQAKTILLAHLQQAERFNVLDRDNLAEARQEAEFGGHAQKILGADYVLTGDVTEFGRRETGDHQLFGVFGRSKTQTAYAKVSLNVVDAATSQVVYAVQGAGEFALSNREVVGFGGTAGYDSTLNGKVLDLAVREAVDRLAQSVDSGAWKPVQR